MERERPSDVEVLPWNAKRYVKNKNKKIRKCGEDYFSLFREYSLQRLQRKQEESTEEEEMKQQQRMTTMKDLTKKIRSKESMDAESRWWVSELLAADCDKAWIHPGWEDTMQKWWDWLETRKKMSRKRWRRGTNKKCRK